MVTLVLSFFSNSVLLLESLLVEPRSEDGQGGRILDLLLPPQGPVFVAKRVRRQHDGKLQLNRLFKIARSHHKLERTNIAQLKL